MAMCAAVQGSGLLRGHVCKEVDFVLFALLLRLICKPYRAHYDAHAARCTHACPGSQAHDETSALASPLCACRGGARGDHATSRAC